MMVTVPRSAAVASPSTGSGQTLDARALRSGAAADLTVATATEARWPR